MEYFDVNSIGPKVIGAWFLICALGWYTYDQTKRWFFATVLTLGLLFFSARVSGVIADHHMDNIGKAADGGLDTATHKARLIGGKRHKTSAGSGHDDNRHFKKRTDRGGDERDW